MAILPVLQYPDPVLRRPCIAVEHFDDQLANLAEDMAQTMYAAQGRGLAAPQVGVSLRLFVMDVDWKEGERFPRHFVNPEIIAASEEMARFTEGCLSIPGVPTDVSRPAEVTLLWQDLRGVGHHQTFTGIAAVCVQHELDHLNGRLCIDLMDESARAAASPTLAALDGIAKVPSP